MFGQQLYWIYTEGKFLIMKLGPGRFEDLHVFVLYAGIVQKPN